MSEQERFIQTWEREIATTLRVLKAFPADKIDLKPTNEKRSARDLAWVLAGCEVMVDGIIKNDIRFDGPPAPPTMKEIIAIFESIPLVEFRRFFVYF